MQDLFAVLLLILAALSFTSGGIFMKSSAGLTRMWPSIFMSVLFVTGAGLQALAMRREDMSVAYISVLGEPDLRSRFDNYWRCPAAPLDPWSRVLGTHEGELLRERKARR
jgi:hypothetical protein